MLRNFINKTEGYTDVNNPFDVYHWLHFMLDAAMSFEPCGEKPKANCDLAEMEMNLAEKVGTCFIFFVDESGGDDEAAVAAYKRAYPTITQLAQMYPFVEPLLLLAAKCIRRRDGQCCYIS